MQTRQSLTSVGLISFVQSVTHSTTACAKRVGRKWRHILLRQPFAAWTFHWHECRALFSTARYGQVNQPPYLTMLFVDGGDNRTRTLSLYSTFGWLISLMEETQQLWSTTSSRPISQWQRKRVSHILNTNSPSIPVLLVQWWLRKVNSGSRCYLNYCSQNSPSHLQRKISANPVFPAYTFRSWYWCGPLWDR